MPEKHQHEYAHLGCRGHRRTGPEPRKMASGTPRGVPEFISLFHGLADLLHQAASVPPFLELLSEVLVSLFDSLLDSALPFDLDSDLAAFPAFPLRL